MSRLYTCSDKKKFNDAYETANFRHLASGGNRALLQDTL